MSRANTGEERTTAIVSSLELAAERCEDIVPLVYDQLFEARADLRELFAIDPDAKPRTGMGNMITEILRIVLAEDDAALEAEAQAAVVFHVGWGLDVRMYRDVMHSVMAAVSAACGDAWTPGMTAAWETRLAEALEALHRQHESIEGPARN